MSDYTRTTRECSLESMQPELSAAIRAHVAKYNLGDILAGVRMCVETESVKGKKNETIYTGAVLTKDWLLWANGGTKTPAHAASARLAQITVQDYASSSLAKLIADTGVTVNGLQTDTPQAGSAFIGLEENGAGRTFREALIAATQTSLR